MLDGGMFMKRIGVLALCLCLILSGCALTQGSYVSITPHLEQQNPEQQETIRATRYDELCTALTDLIDSGLSGGIISVSEYPADRVRGDMERAVAYACENYPMGAYAVEHISWEFGTASGGAVFAVSIHYSRTPGEIDRIQAVAGMDGARSAICGALDRCSDSLVLKIARYEDWDFAQIVEDYATDNPNMVMEIPQVTAGFYPETGSARIVELKFTYQTRREALRQMQNEVQSLFEAAQTYISGDGEEREKYTQLYAFLMERFDYRVETSLIPAYSLLRYGVGDSKAFASVYSAMCRSAGLDCVNVTGTRDGEPWTWNILRDGDTYYHVDLLRSAELGGLQTWADEEMTGYVWDYSAFPACGVPAQEPELDLPPGVFIN